MALRPIGSVALLWCGDRFTVHYCLHGGWCNRSGSFPIFSSSDTPEEDLQQAVRERLKALGLSAYPYLFKVLRRDWEGDKQ
jgi:hypothetical protein